MQDFTYANHINVLNRRYPKAFMSVYNVYLWWGRRKRTSKESTIIIGVNSALPLSLHPRCHKTNGSIPRGKATFSFSSFISGVGFKPFREILKGVVKPHGTNRLRNESRWCSWSRQSLLSFKKGGLKGFLATDTPSDAAISRRPRGCGPTTWFPLQNTCFLALIQREVTWASEFHVHYRN